MRLFRKKKLERLPIDIPQEIIDHKQTVVDVVNDVNKANDTLHKVFDANHFNIKMFILAGASSPRRKV